MEQAYREIIECFSTDYSTMNGGDI